MQFPRALARVLLEQHGASGPVVVRCSLGAVPCLAPGAEGVFGDAAADEGGLVLARPGATTASRGLTLNGGDLIDADQVVQQISLDGAREDRLVAEAAIDRIRAESGPCTFGPAATSCRAS